MMYNGIPEGIPVIDESVKKQILAEDAVEAVSFYTKRQDGNNGSTIRIPEQRAA